MEATVHAIAGHHQIVVGLPQPFLHPQYHRCGAAASTGTSRIASQVLPRQWGSCEWRRSCHWAASRAITSSSRQADRSCYGWRG
jgi:hypothetical protein